MENKKIFGVPITLWLFPPAALFLIVTNAIKSILSKKKERIKMNNFAPLLVFIVAAGAWFQHLYTCFTEESWGFLIAGALFFPVAIVHGVGI